jgi:hypothetical protein
VTPLQKDDGRAEAGLIAIAGVALVAKNRHCFDLLDCLCQSWRVNNAVPSTLPILETPAQLNPVSSHITTFVGRLDCACAEGIEF